mmetsp:Transcript_23645/g.50066  ORF Transcript_23645/g.50066 Transcript_23645/m.50066 type:complete len:218 (-) Transcript_23645:1557-2210(-)
MRFLEHAAVVVAAAAAAVAGPAVEHDERPMDAPMLLPNETRKRTDDEDDVPDIPANTAEGGDAARDDGWDIESAEAVAMAVAAVEIDRDAAGAVARGALLDRAGDGTDCGSPPSPPHAHAPPRHDDDDDDAIHNADAEDNEDAAAPNAADCAPSSTNSSWVSPAVAAAARSRSTPWTMTEQWEDAPWRQQQSSCRCASWLPRLPCWRRCHLCCSRRR